tara:strand:+ start:743 stop:1072 length:330 start_codon:yes stop_codon:yes gene_type:complete
VTVVHDYYHVVLDWLTYPGSSLGLQDELMDIWDMQSNNETFHIFLNGQKAPKTCDRDTIVEFLSMNGVGDGQMDIMIAAAESGVPFDTPDGHVVFKRCSNIENAADVKE